MYQQRIELVKHVIKCFSWLQLAVTYVLSLNRH